MQVLTQLEWAVPSVLAQEYVCWIACACCKAAAGVYAYTGPS